MTRLLTTGYETGDANEAGVTTLGTGGAITAANSTPTPRAGSYCLKVASTGATFNPTYKTFTFAAAKTEVWARFAFLAHNAASITEVPIVLLNDAVAGVQTALTYSPVDTFLRLYRGAPTTNLLGTSGTGIPQDTWHVIEWRTLISTATTGTSEVWLDGNRVINFSGDNSNTATLNVQSIRFGYVNGAGLASPTGLYLGFDDLAVNDTTPATPNNAQIGDGRVLLLMPTGAGSSTMLARGGVDTGTNYGQVNELPPSLAQYVLSSTVADRDLYAMADLAVAVSSINCVEAIVLAQNSDAGAGSIAPTLKSGATVNEATAISLGTTAGYVTSRWETDPATSVAWTLSGLNAVEAGVTVR
jgi:hypothetical protein